MHRHADRSTDLISRTICSSDDEVEALLAEQLAAIDHRIALFALERDPRRVKLERKRPRVDRLEQARPECAMNGDAATDGVVNQRFEVVRQRAVATRSI